MLMFDTSRRQRLVATRRLCRLRRRLFKLWKVEEQLHGGWTALGRDTLRLREAVSILQG